MLQLMHGQVRIPDVSFFSWTHFPKGKGFSYNVKLNVTSPRGVTVQEVFTNYSVQQTGMVIHVLQGERELADDCRSLARFELKGIPRLPPSMARVEVSFQLDADALLTVTARELMTGVKQSVEVKPTYGLLRELHFDFQNAADNQIQL